jgi:DNA polymerase I
MPGRFVFDLESDGLLPELTKLHCLGIKCLDTGEVWSLKTRTGMQPALDKFGIYHGLRMLSNADLIVGHNIIGFDIPAIQKVYPWFQPKGLVRDTLVLTRLMWPHIEEPDHKLVASGKLPRKYRGSHGLAAWGYRLGELKDEYSGGWESWSPKMQAYMDQDVVVTEKLWHLCVKEAEAWGVPIDDPNPPPKADCIELEHRVAEICVKIEKHGWAFDFDAANKLVSKLTARKMELAPQLQELFPPRTVKTTFIPKSNNKRYGYVKGQPFTKEKVVPFNPNSRQQIAERLQELGWKPTSYGDNGSPTVDDEILQSLPYPQAKVLAEWFVVEKRLGQVANGKEAWFRHERGGRIHGRIKSGGAHTGRMTHSSPNVAQVPGNHAPYGEECRTCWTADVGFKLVGVDADALELRDLAGYMALWDDGAYIETVLKGDKKLGTDMHTINAKLIGCDRDVAKTFFYAMIYGSGDPNLGAVIGKNAAAGKAARERLMKGVPALGALVAAVHKRVETKGYLIGLDGRRLRARAKNAALNTLLQSAGAVQMKRGLVILYDRLTSEWWEWGKDYSIVGLIHDEWQANVIPAKAEQYGQRAVQSIRDAGSYYAFKCPLDGQFKIGENWADTH